MMVYYDEDATLEIDEFPKFREELKSMGIEELLFCYTTAYENYMAARK